MTSIVDDLLRALDLEAIDRSAFRGESLQVGWHRIFGGLVIAQAAVAATRTVPRRPLHSLHGYFLLPGDPAQPIEYRTDVLRDGGSFSTCSVTALQNGTRIFTALASFHAPELGFDHAAGMPPVPPPEDLPEDIELVGRFGDRLPGIVRRQLEIARPIELRPVDTDRVLRAGTAGPHPVRQAVWMRARSALPDDDAVHRAVLAYASDMTLLDTALIAHGTSVFDAGLQVASLDHALWFHRPCRADDWLLYSEDTPSSFGSRGFTRGQIFTRSGTLVASVAQEGLMRRRRGNGFLPKK